MTFTMDHCKELNFFFEREKMYLVNDDVIHILSNDDNFVFYYQKKKIEEKKIGGRERTMSLRMGFFPRVYD